MKKVFGLIMVLALAGLVSCGEATTETPTDAATTVEVEAPVVEVEAPVVAEEAPVVVDEVVPATEEAAVVAEEVETPSAE